MKKFLLYIKLLTCFSFLIDVSISQISQQWISKFSHKSSSEDVIEFFEIDNFRNIYVAGLSNNRFFIAKYSSSGVQLWSNTYYENIDGDDFLGGLKIDATGNVYLTANVLGTDTTYDIITIKYNSSGVQQWIARFKSLRTDEISVGLAIDSRGNIYVAGYQYNIVSKNDFILIKYNSAGVQQWMRRENGIGNDDDVPVGVIIDANNNIFVTGYTNNPSSFIDFMTIKFDTTGFTHWKVYYDGTGFDEDIPVAIGLDNFNNVYVLGSSYGDTTDLDFCVVKYNNSGTQQWVARYNSPFSMEDIPTSFKVTYGGTVFITGYTYNFLSMYNYLTVKVNSNGTIEWAVQENGSGDYDDFAYDITTDASENVYVTGSSSSIFGILEISTVKYNGFGVRQWNISYSSSQEFPAEAIGIRLDNLGGIIVAGYAFTLQNANDGILIKYNASGIQQWLTKINFFDEESFDDFPYDIKVDNSGNLYVVGTSYDNGTLYDFITIKYGVNGNILWSARYDGESHDNDEAFAVGVDKHKNVYVTGRSYSNFSDDDIILLKYSESGNLLWQRKFNGSADSVDQPLKMLIDSLSNIIIVGSSYTSSGGFDIVTLKYNSNGQLLWTKYFNSFEKVEDIPTAACFDKNGNIYIAGQFYSTNNKVDAMIIKYGADGTQEWVRFYNGPSSDNDIPTSIATDTLNNVVVSIASNNSGTGTDIVLIKFSSSGIQSWIRTYNNSSNGLDYPKRISITPGGDIYVGGWTENGASLIDMILLKYSPAGVKLWESKFNGIYNDYDYLEDMYVDRWGNSYISGTVENPNGKNNYVTLKYNTNGVLQWNVYYYNNYSTNSEVMYIEVDDLGNIFVTGVEYDSLDYSDIVTIMYKQNTYITGTVFFDVNNNGVKDLTDLPLIGWKVIVTGAKKDSAITDSSGRYVIQNIPFGSYSINQAMKPDWIQTMPPTGGYSILINSNNLSGVFDFGNYSSKAISFQIDGRWNLMSLPLRVIDRRKTTIFGSAVSSAFAFDNGYVIKDTLNYMQGYWMKFPYPHILWIAGNRFNDDSVEVKTGWNLIGTISYPISVSTIQTKPANIITSAFYGYKNGYFITDSLRPIQGYWVKVNQNGYIIAKRVTSQAKSSDESFISEVKKIKITDSDGNFSTLYLTDLSLDNTSKEYFSAPPLPPLDAFDVRFENGYLVFDSNDKIQQKIILANPKFPLTISWENFGDLRYEIYDNSKSINAQIRGNSGSITIDNLTSNEFYIKSMSSQKGNVLPEKYVLHQNYPNPFNSKTIIKYELPKPDNVTIKIFNPLGEELATLVDEYKTEGYHAITFDATKFASGIYFCKMTASEYFGVIKILLIK